MGILKVHQNLGKRTGVILCHFTMIIICSIFLFPVVYIILNSLRPEKIMFEYPPRWIFVPTFNNWIKAFWEYHFHVNLLNSVIISSGATGIGVAIAAAAAYVIGRYQLTSVSFIILATMTVPYLIALIPLYLLFRTLGWLDTRSALILTHLIITAPQSLWILIGFVEGIPSAIEEAAILDGCSRMQVFSKIVLPLIRPGLVVASIVSFALSWNDFKLALVLSVSQKTYTAPMGLYNFIGQRSIDWSGLSAATSIMIIPTIIFVLLVQKHLLRGLAVGGIK